MKNTGNYGILNIPQSTCPLN